MGGPTFDVVRNPVGAVRRMFEKTRDRAQGDLASLASGDWGEAELFRDALFKDGLVQSVPVLGAASLGRHAADRCLVRFCAMVQDMWDTEFYQGLFRDTDGTLRTSKYGERLEAQSEGVSNGTQLEAVEGAVWERQVYYCTPVPGLQPWANQALLSSSNRTSAANQILTSSPVAGSGVTEEGASGSDVTGDISSTGVGSRRGSGPLVSEPQAKRQRGEGDGQGLGTTVDVVVKMYGPDSGLKLNDVAEFVGVLYVIDGHSEVNSVGADEPIVMDDGEDCKAPRLHCLAFRKLPSPFPLPLSPLPPSVPSIRESLLSQLSLCLGGEATSAEYLLLHLISRVHSRVEPMALGKLSLNFFGKSTAPGAGPSLADALNTTVEALLPASVALDLQCVEISRQRLAPWKDYARNRLVTGKLQLTAGTHLMVNEKTLQPGSVTELGVGNLRTLSELAQTQKVPYDFQYYSVDMPADVAVLVLSEARSRIIATDVCLPVAPSTVLQKFPASHPEVDTWRRYIGSARGLNHQIDGALQAHIEGELVAARQADHAKGPENFHRWLTMARLVAASYGCCLLAREHWDRVRHLEHIAEERLRML